MNSVYDVQHIKANADCMQLISQETGQEGKGRSYYRQFTCPFCGQKSKSTFTAWKECWKCWKGCSSGDAITFLMHYRGMAFKAACQYLGGQLAPMTFAERLPTRTLPPDTPPDQEWVIDATDLVARAKSKLWGEGGKKGMAYLLQRGFSPDTIDQCNFGYIPPYHHPHAYFVHGIWLTEGIVIPSYRDGQLWNARIRTFNPQLRYVNFQGGKLAGSLWGGDNLRPFEPVWILEGDFNAAIIRQLGYQAVSTSSASTTVSPYWYRKLISAPFVLVWGDDNAAGQRFNHNHCEIGPLFHPVMGNGQDANDLYLADAASLAEFLGAWEHAYHQTHDDFEAYALTLGAVIEDEPIAAAKPMALYPTQQIPMNGFESKGRLHYA